MAFEDRKNAASALRAPWGTPSTRKSLGPLSAAVAALAIVAGGAQAAAPAAGAEEDSTAAAEGSWTPARASTVPQVTIEAQRQAVERTIHTFVSNMTHAPAGAENDPLQMWRQPICFIVAGLPRGRGEFVLERLSAAVEAAGAPLAPKNDCHPNFYVVATAHPEELLRAWHRHDSTMYGYAAPMPVHAFVDMPRPVRVWYNTYLTDTQGNPATTGAANVVAGMGSNANHATITDLQQVVGDASYLEYNAVRDFHSVLVVVDLKRVKNLEWGQVADYIAMAGLTRVNMDADYSESDSILRLFANARGPLPSGLSTWDKSFLKALYHTRQEVKGQRIEIAGHMMKDIAPNL
jgi:hypothetical protein